MKSQIDDEEISGITDGNVVQKGEQAPEEKIDQVKSLELDGFTGFVSNTEQMRWLEAQSHLVHERSVKKSLEEQEDGAEDHTIPDQVPG